MRKPVFGYSDQVQHKLDCTTRGDGSASSISSMKFQIKKEETLYSLCSENKGADLHLCFTYANSGFLMLWLILYPLHSTASASHQYCCIISAVYEDVQS